MRDLRYTGPGAVLVSIEHQRQGRARELSSRGTARPGLRSVLRLSQQAHARGLAQPQVIVLHSRARLRVRSRFARNG